MSRTIVITGGGSGLGRALGRRFASESDTVLLLERNQTKAEKVAAEIKGHVFACDIADPASVNAAFASIAKRFPRIDVLINNAGIFQPSSIAEASDAHILDTTTINFCGPMFCVRAALPLMTAGSHIINITSESVVLPFPFMLVYEASKAGLERFSQGLERELEPEGIRVTCFRAGQMMDADSMPLAIAPALMARFRDAIVANGLGGRPASQYDSATDAFLAVVNMPEDVQVPLVTLCGRKPEVA